MHQRDTLVHLFAGGCGGTVGAILTCPLEVVKTRLQSSGITFRPLYLPEVHLHAVAGGGGSASFVRPVSVSPGVLHILKTILQKEGARSLFRGLGPNLVGVAPSRAIYFAMYSGAKEKLNLIFDPECTKVHLCAAAFAGFTSITATNPIWLVKTRLQLEAKKRGEKRMNTLQCIRRVYQTEGTRGFYRGMTASYAGISETMIHFVIYEALKQRLKERSYTPPSGSTPKQESLNFLGLMVSAAVSKTCASVIAYPHEVIRTRLREEGSKYKSFTQTVHLVATEEGYRAFYRGLLAQMIRQIPNTAIMMVTYEFIVFLVEKV
ncbi:solute carrier family 25 member 36 isoform X1 [Latimeria chalumnae]|uniref:Solute carrier family 25 member 33 n=1 Tax=Latimeria chalumnae TaxID=7897 RepID=H2ZUW2_LATCH|nr:PREDICTED: solute carrier family 25 member 36-like isoform X1 [Latimeria chalumnae]|eukprot:XP_006013231.1 PREDICTED: solute carrier family 25 member 36-like isoform X1 [Latimeria chalumnae]